MEEAGFLRGTWGESESRRRAKYYELTPSGRRQLELATEHWEKVSVAIAAALKTT
jgi:DNA-binding PadR family transcriptional regulator